MFEIRKKKLPFFINDSAFYLQGSQKNISISCLVFLQYVK